METQLSTIDDTFQSGKHKEAIAEIQTLIETYPKDDGIYKAYDHLAGYFNLMGQHVEAVEAWINALKSLEDVAGSVNNLREAKMIDWMNISLQVARVSHRQGKIYRQVKLDNLFRSIIGAEGSGLSNSEEAEWKQQRFQTAIKHYRAVLEKLPESGSDIKKTIRTELTQVLFDADNIDEAVQMYEDAFKVSIFLYFEKLLFFSLISKRTMEMPNGFTKQLIVYGNKEKKNKHTLVFNN